MVHHYLQNYITVSQWKAVLIRVLTSFSKWGNKVKNSDIPSLRSCMYVLVLYLYFPTYQLVSSHKNCFFENPGSNFVYNGVLSHYAFLHSKVKSSNYWWLSFLNKKIDYWLFLFLWVSFAVGTLGIIKTNKSRICNEIRNGSYIESILISSTISFI